MNEKLKPQIKRERKLKLYQVTAAPHFHVELKDGLRRTKMFVKFKQKESFISAIRLSESDKSRLRCTK
jgi:hypothetical protein